MAGCTFKPAIKSPAYKEQRKGKVYEKLFKKAKDHKALDEIKKKLEVKDCSFKPKIDKMSQKLVKQ